MFQVLEQRFHSSLWCRQWRGSCAPVTCRGPWWRRYPPAACGGSHTGAGPKESVALWKACSRAGSWQDLWPHGDRSPHWRTFVGRTCDPTAVMCWSSTFLKDCTPQKGPPLQQFMKNCSPWEGLTTFCSGVLSPVEGAPQWSRERVSSPPLLEEGTAETTCGKLIAEIGRAHV